MRNFNVRKSFLLFSDDSLRLYLKLDHTIIYIRLRPSLQNLRFRRRIRSAILEEKVILPLRGINEYCGRAAFFRWFENCVADQFSLFGHTNSKQLEPNRDLLPYQSRIRSWAIRTSHYQDLYWKYSSNLYTPTNLMFYSYNHFEVDL